MCHHTKDTIVVVATSRRCIALACIAACEAYRRALSRRCRAHAQRWPWAVRFGGVRVARPRGGQVHPMPRQLVSVVQNLPVHSPDAFCWWDHEACAGGGAACCAGVQGADRRHGGARAARGARRASRRAARRGGAGGARAVLACALAAAARACVGRRLVRAVRERVRHGAQGVRRHQRAAGRDAGVRHVRAGGSVLQRRNGADAAGCRRRRARVRGARGVELLGGSAVAGLRAGRALQLRCVLGACHAAAPRNPSYTRVRRARPPPSARTTARRSRARGGCQLLPRLPSPRAHVPWRALPRAKL
jgi:hypothetical protein